MASMSRLSPNLPNLIPHKAYYLRHLYVDRGFRRQGIATQLLDWMYANIWTYKKVRLGVLAHNEGAIAFYEQYGFEIQALQLEK